MEVFDSIGEFLGRHGLGWVVNQVAEQVRIGRTVLTEVDTLKRGTQEELGFSVTAFKKGPRARFMATAEYSAKEKLLLLLDAVQQTVIITNEMASQVLDTMTKTIGASELVFYSEELGQDVLVLDHNKIAPVQQGVSELRDLLGKLRDEVQRD
jgi:hypothetical protein